MWTPCVQFSRFLIIAKSIFDISSDKVYRLLNSSEDNSSLSLKISKIATHSKTEPRAITQKFFLSGLLNLLVPSAIFSTILKDALLSWFLVVLSIGLVSSIIRQTVELKALAFLYTSRFSKSNIYREMCECGSEY